MSKYVTLSFCTIASNGRQGFIMNSTSSTYRIGVFTPHIDGEYFGKLLSTISEDARYAGRRPCLH
jgi:hypothetical protein